MSSTKALCNVAPTLSLPHHAEQRFARLCDAAGFREDSARARAIFSSIVMPAISSTPNGWISDVSDEQTPIEFSVALHGDRAEVRVLFEAQGRTNSLASYRTAALAVTRQVSQTLGADLTKFKAVADLFLPMRMIGPFAMWHSLVFKRDGIDAKVYFNTQARGLGRTHATVEEALHRLGFPGAWASLVHSSLRRGPKLDEVKYLALDLSSASDARDKVYVRHHSASITDLEKACSASSEYVPGEASDFARAMSGGAEVLQRRAPFTCSAFSGERQDRPSATTLYVPVCAYASDDGAVTTRVSEHLEQRDLPASSYRQLISEYSDRDLQSGIGMQSWVAFRRLGKKARLTVYLSAESRGVLEPGTIPAPSGDRTVCSSPEAAMEDLALYSVAHHPVMRLLRAPGGHHEDIRRGLVSAVAPWLDAVPAGCADPSAELGQAFKDLNATWTDLKTHLQSAQREAAFPGARILSEQLVNAIDRASAPGRPRPRLWPEVAKARQRSSAPSVTTLSLGACHDFGGVEARGSAREKSEEARELTAGALLAAHAALWQLLDVIYVQVTSRNAMSTVARAE